MKTVACKKKPAASSAAFEDACESLSWLPFPFKVFSILSLDLKSTIPKIPCDNVLFH